MRLAGLLCFLVMSFSCFAGDCKPRNYILRQKLEILKIGLFLIKNKHEELAFLKHNSFCLSLDEKNMFQNEIDELYRLADEKKLKYIASRLRPAISEKNVFSKEAYANLEKYRSLNSQLNDYVVSFWKENTSDLSCASSSICSKIFAIKDAVLNNASFKDFTYSFFSTKEIKKNAFLREYIEGLCPFISDQCINSFVRCKLKNALCQNSSKDSPCSPVSPIVSMLAMCQNKECSAKDLKNNLNILGAIERNEYKKKFNNHSKVLISPKRRKNIKKARHGAVKPSHFYLGLQSNKSERRKAFCLKPGQDYQSSLFD